MMHHIEIGRATPGARLVSRRAVKVIARRNGRLLMLRSAVGGDYKFVGGGVEHGESDEQALAREVSEECGRDVIDCGPAMVRLVETRPDRLHHDADFQMVSLFYACDVSAPRRAPKLDEYEQGLGLISTWVGAAEALAVNEGLLAATNAAAWVGREAAVLRWISAGGDSTDAT